MMIYSFNNIAYRIIMVVFSLYVGLTFFYKKPTGYDLMWLVTWSIFFVFIMQTKNHYLVTNNKALRLAKIQKGKIKKVYKEINWQELKKIRFYKRFPVGFYLVFSKRNNGNTLKDIIRIPANTPNLKKLLDDILSHTNIKIT